MLVIVFAVFTTATFASNGMQEFADSLTVTTIDSAAVTKDSLAVEQPVFTEIVGNIQPAVDGKSIWLAIILPAIIGMCVSLFTDAFKYVKAGLWNGKIFIETKLIPASIALAIILGSWALTAWLPEYSTMLISLLGDNAELSSGMFGGAITAVIDNLAKPKKVVPETTT